MTCKECVHFEICELMSAQYGISKIPTRLCGYFKSDVAREIFEEIEKTAIQTYAELNSAPIAKIDERTHIFALGKIKMLQDAYYFIAELKNKYFGEDINIPTKESEDTE